jgi:hypothetical protein
VIRTGEALQTFASIVSDPYPSPEAAFKAILLFDPTDTIMLQIGGPDVGPFNCRTTVASQDQPSTATIDCGIDKPLNQYTIVHELGHVFYKIASIPLSDLPIEIYPCYSREYITQSLAPCVEKPVQQESNGSLGINNEFISGFRSMYYTREDVDNLISRLGILGVTSASFTPYLAYFAPHDPTEYFFAGVDWLRGSRGWGSTAPITGPCGGKASSSFLPTNFQQNPCEVYPWLLRGDTEIEVKKITEVEEAFADLFLNWIYRTLGVGGFENRNARGESDTLIISNLAIFLPHSFPNVRAGPGDDRFYWMNHLLQRLFAYYDF